MEVIGLLPRAGLGQKYSGLGSFIIASNCKAFLSTRILHAKALSKILTANCILLQLPSALLLFNLTIRSY